MQVEILGINFQGDGYGIINKKKVIIPKTCKGDLVEFKIIKENKDFIFGKLVKILQKSNERVDNVICPIYDTCGGCNLLHLKEDIYRQFKIAIIHDTLKKSGYTLDNVNLISIGYNSRRRATFKVKNNKIGFFEKNSNNLVDVQNCPLITKNINDLIPQLSQLVKKILIDEISITEYENGIELLLVLRKNPDLNENKILKSFIEQNEDIIVISYEIKDEEPYLFFQKVAPVLTFDNGVKLELDSNIFIQATLDGQKAITNIVVDNLKNCKNILDLYCGIGTYSFPLSTYTKVHSVEGSQRMIDILNRNIRNNKLSSRITTECRNLVSSPLLKNELNEYDGIVINPPRNGAKAQCQQIAKSNIKNIVMVSCNPQTFAIDANELRLAGYNLEELTGIDQFYKTQHLEVVGVFRKK